MSDETKSILMNPDVIAIDQDASAKPVRKLLVEGKSELLVRPLSGDALAVALFNRGDQPVDVSFRWTAWSLAPTSGPKSWRHRIGGNTRRFR